MIREEFEADVRAAEAIGSDSLVELALRRHLTKGTALVWVGVSGCLAFSAACVYVLFLRTSVSGFAGIGLFFAGSAIIFLVRTLRMLPPGPAGLRVGREDAPNLWRLVDEAAPNHGARKPKMIALTHEKDIVGVPYRTWFGGKTHSALTISFTALICMSRSEFRLAIAEEMLLIRGSRLALEVSCFQRGFLAATLHRHWKDHIASKNSARRTSPFERYQSRLEALRAVLSRRQILEADQLRAASVGPDAVIDAISRPLAYEYADWEARAEAVTGPYSSWTKYREMLPFVRSKSANEIKEVLETCLQVSETLADLRPSRGVRIAALGKPDAPAIADRLVSAQTWGIDDALGEDQERWLEAIDRHYASYLESVQGHQYLQNELTFLEALPPSEWEKAHFVRASQLRLDIGQIELARDTLRDGRAKFPENRDLIWLEACLAVKEDAPDKMDRMREVAARDFLRKPAAISTMVSLLREQGNSKEAYDIEWRWEEELEGYESHFMAMMAVNDGRFTAQLRVIEPDADAHRAAAEIREKIPNANAIYFLQRIDPSGHFEPKFIVVETSRRWYRWSEAQYEELSRSLQGLGAQAIEWHVAALRHGGGLANRIKSENLRHPEP